MPVKESNYCEILTKGAIKAPSAEMRSKINASTSEISGFDNVYSAVRNLGSEFVWAKRIQLRKEARRRDPATQNSDATLLLLRLSEGMSDTFALSREIPVLVSRHDDIQSRLIVKAISELQEILDRSFESRHLFIFEPRSHTVGHRDTNPIEQVKPLWISGRSSKDLSESFIRVLVRNFRSPDRYDIRTPVVASDFFGRDPLLTELLHGIDTQQVHGIFGLRKTGKTSVLKELEQRYGFSPSNHLRKQQRRRIFVYFDLEGYDFMQPQEVHRMCRALAKEISQKLSDSGFSRTDLWNYYEGSSSRFEGIGGFFDALSSTLNYKKNSLDNGFSLVLMLDEIEHFVPIHDQGKVAERELLQFLQNLRKLLQDSQSSDRPTKFTFLIAGLAPAIAEDTILLGGDNPLFRLVSSHFLGPLSSDESTGLLENIGSSMGMAWEPDALDMAFEETGGSVVLLRELGSTIAKKREEYNFNKFIVSRLAIESASVELPQKSKDYLQQAVDHLETRYPDEAALLSLALDSGMSIQDAAKQSDFGLDRFENLGLIELQAGVYTESKLLSLALDVQRSKKKLQTRSVIARSQVSVRQRVEELISIGENREIEFKSTYLVPLDRSGLPRESPADGLVKEVRFSSFKTVAAFANSGGGTLLIGVDDNGESVGVDHCIAECGNEDKLLQRISTDFENFTTQGDISSTYNISSVMINGKTILVVQVSPSRIYSHRKAVKTTDSSEGIFVRRQVSTIFLDGAQMVEYVTSPHD